MSKTVTKGSVNTGLTSQTQKDIMSTELVREEVGKIILPKNMPLNVAAKELNRRFQEEETLQTYNRTLKDKFYYIDILNQAEKAIKEVFGWIDSSKAQSMDIVEGYDKEGNVIRKSIFTGEFKVAAMEDAKGIIKVNSYNSVTLVIQCKGKYKSHVNKFFDLVEYYLHNESLYRGKTVEITHKKTAMGEFTHYEIIRNMENKDEIIKLNQDTQTVVDIFIKGQLTKEGKKAFLFSGGYGNGKTKTAFEIGREANAKNMPFFYVSDIKSLPDVLKLARTYSPSVVFVEDIDSIAGRQDRDLDMNYILNTLDGPELAGSATTVIVTTNHQESLNRALLRPGRLDKIIEFKDPTFENTVAIFKAYIDKFVNVPVRLSEGLIEEAATKLRNMSKHGSVSGSFISRVAKEFRILADDSGELTDRMFMACVISMESHISFMEAPIEDEDSKVTGMLATLGDKILGHHIQD
jgi:hypothetical protein